MPKAFVGRVCGGGGQAELVGHRSVRNITVGEL